MRRSKVAATVLLTVLVLASGCIGGVDQPGDATARGTTDDVTPPRTPSPTDGSDRTSDGSAIDENTTLTRTEPTTGTTGTDPIPERMSTDSGINTDGTDVTGTDAGRAGRVELTDLDVSAERTEPGPVEDLMIEANVGDAAATDSLGTVVVESGALDLSGFEPLSASVFGIDRGGNISGVNDMGVSTDVSIKASIREVEATENRAVVRVAKNPVTGKRYALRAGDEIVMILSADGDSDGRPDIALTRTLEDTSEAVDAITVGEHVETDGRVPSEERETATGAVAEGATMMTEPADPAEPTELEEGQEPAGGRVTTELEAEVVSEPPTGATVLDASNDRIEDVEPIQRVLRQAVENRTDRWPGVTITLEAGEADRVEEALGRFERYENEAAGVYGYFVRYRGTLVRINVVGVKQQ
jgi:hypothetical protein